MASARPVNPRAFEAFFRGLSFQSRLTAPDLETAFEYLELALDIDPDFAPAYGAMAVVWLNRMQMGFVPHSEAAPKARAALARSLELDSTAAEQHGVLGTMRFLID